jgi:hypothetical protein
MKLTEFKKLIREEVKKTLNEANGTSEYTVINLWDKIDGKFRTETIPANSADTALLSYLKKDGKYADYGAQAAMAYVKKSTKLVQDGDITMYLGKGTFNPDYIIAPGQVDRKAALQILKDKIFNK